MLTDAFWKWLKRNDPLLTAIQQGECSEQQLEILCQCLEDWVIAAQSYGYPYVELEFLDLPQSIAIEFIHFLEEQNFQGFLARTEEKDKLYILISGWYPEHKLPKFDGRVYQFKTAKALERKLPDFAKQRENDQVFYETVDSFDRFTYKWLHFA